MGWYKEKGSEELVRYNGMLWGFLRKKEAQLSFRKKLVVVIFSTFGR